MGAPVWSPSRRWSSRSRESRLAQAPDPSRALPWQRGAKSHSCTKCPSPGDTLLSPGPGSAEQSSACRRGNSQGKAGKSSSHLGVRHSAFTPATANMVLLSAAAQGASSSQCQHIIGRRGTRTLVSPLRPLVPAQGRCTTQFLLPATSSSSYLIRKLFRSTFSAHNARAQPRAQSSPALPHWQSQQ